MMRIYRNIAFLIVAMTFMSAYVADAMKLNGTRIDKKNNLFGLVKDSRTGKGIAGVPVTDGYTFPGQALAGGEFAVLHGGQQLGADGLRLSRLTAHVIHLIKHKIGTTH